MYKVGDFVINKMNVCKIIDYKNDYLNNKDYYILVPVDDESLKIKLPVNDNQLRNLISKKELENIIDNIPNIEPLSCEERHIENEYKNLFSQGTHEALIKIIKTTFLRNKIRLDNKKKISEIDNTYFIKAERCLYTEFSIVLNTSYEETKQYVIDKVFNIIKE